MCVCVSVCLLFLYISEGMVLHVCTELVCIILLKQIRHQNIETMPMLKTHTSPEVRSILTSQPLKPQRTYNH